MQQFPFTASEHSIALFFRGKMRNIPSTDPGFADLYEHLKLSAHDESVVERIVDKPAMIERLMVGDVKVVGSGVFYRGSPIHSSLAEKLVRMLDAGFDATNWARFLTRVMQNPSERSKNCLYDFLSRWNAPITEDGCFIAFKRVRGDYRDIHSNTMDNSPGQVVEMERSRVNDDPDQSCSYGLHVAATPYLGHFYASTDGYRVVACKVDPVDVVAVPRDYNGAKMRVCKYLVLGDAEEQMYDNAETIHVYDTTELVEDAGIDVKGLRICADPVTFSEDWRRDIKAVIVKGSIVAPTAYSNDTLPSNKFMVGVVTASERDDKVQIVDVEWQDGTTSQAVIVDDLTPLNSGVVAVTYVGEEPVDDDDGVDDYDWTTDGDDDFDEEVEAIHNLPFEDEVEETSDEDQPTGFVAFYGPIDVEKTFTKDGVTYTASTIRDGVSTYGQRGYARLTGIPRTTLQEWLKAL